MKPLFSPLLCTIVALACMNADATSGRQLTVTGGGRVVGDSVKLGTGVSLKSYVAGKDTVRFRYYRNDTLLVTRRRVAAPVVIDSTKSLLFDAAYKGCVQIERGGRTSGIVFPPSPVCWAPWRPALPPAEIDSAWQVVLKPPSADASATLAGVTPAPVNQVQFCMFAIGLQTGRKVKMMNSWNRQECEEPFQGWLMEQGA